MNEGRQDKERLKGDMNLSPALKQKIQFFASKASSSGSRVSPYLCPSSSGTAYDIAFLVHDLNPSRGLETSGRNNIHSTDLGCMDGKRTQRDEFRSRRGTSCPVSSLSLMAALPQPLVST